MAIQFKSAPPNARRVVTVLFAPLVAMVCVLFIDAVLRLQRLTYFIVPLLPIFGVMALWKSSFATMSGKIIVISVYYPAMFIVVALLSIFTGCAFTQLFAYSTGLCPF